MQNKPNTGLMQFENDWSGVFIRGEHVIDYTILLTRLKNNYLDQMDDRDKAQLEELIHLLQEVDTAVFSNKVQKMRGYNQCVKKSFSLRQIFGKGHSDEAVKQSPPKFNTGDTVEVISRGTQAVISDRRCNASTQWNWQYRVKIQSSGIHENFYEGDLHRHA